MKNEKLIKKSKLYMNQYTGSVDNYDGWWYEDEDENKRNAVDEGEVVEVERIEGGWVEVNDVLRRKQ